MLRKLYKCGLILSILVCVLPAMAQQTRIFSRDNDGQKRLALIIGNGNYVNARKLVNPPNDAADMTVTLTELGFEVISGTNLNLKQMTEKVREFGDKLRTSGGVGLFYYAGHGVQVNGRNYLIPVEADIPREDEIGFVALDLNQVLQKMATANNGLNIVVLDACRNNPFARGWSRDASDDGLAQITAPKGTFIAYATSPDMTASDGTGRNGLYTAELLKYIKQPNLKIEETFKEVTKAVDDKSGGKQTPWFSSSLRGEFIFKPNQKTASVTKPNLTEKPALVNPPTSLKTNISDKSNANVPPIDTLPKKESLDVYIPYDAVVNGNLTEIKGKRKVYVSVNYSSESKLEPYLITSHSSSKEDEISRKWKEQREQYMTNELKNIIISRLKKYVGLEIVETPEASDFIIFYRAFVFNSKWQGPSILGKTETHDKFELVGNMFVVVLGNNTSNDSNQFRLLWNYNTFQTKRRSTEKMTDFLIDELKKARGEK